MAITLNATSKTRALILSGTSTNTMSINAGTGSNRLLVVIFCQRGNPLRTYSTVTYNSVAMTKVTTVGTETAETIDLEVTIWYLIAPTTGTNNLSLTMSGTTTVEAMAFVIEGVDQTSPLDQEVNGSGTNDTAMSISITPTVDNEFIVGGIVHEAATALTVGSGETSLYDTDQGAWVTSGSYVIQTTKGTQAVNWTAGAGDNWAGLTASFKEAASGTTVTPVVAACIASTTTPTIILGALSVTPVVAASIARVTDPAVVLGSLVITPGAAACIARVTDPGVLTGGLVVDPGVSACIARVTDPSVVLSSVAVTPVAATCIARVTDPGVLIEGGGASPSSAKPWKRLRLRNKVV